MKRSGQLYMVVEKRSLQGGGEEQILRLQSIAPSWRYQIRPSRGGFEGTLLDGNTHVKLRIVSPDELGAVLALDAYMKDTRMPRKVRVVTRGDLRPANTCMYCGDGLPRGMLCRRSACMVKMQIDIVTRGRPR